MKIQIKVPHVPVYKNKVDFPNNLIIMIKLISQQVVLSLTLVLDHILYTVQCTIYVCVQLNSQ